MYAKHKKSGVPYQVKEFLGGEVVIQTLTKPHIERWISHDDFKKMYQLVDEVNYKDSEGNLIDEIISESKQLGGERSDGSKRKHNNSSNDDSPSGSVSANNRDNTKPKKRTKIKIKTKQKDRPRPKNKKKDQKKKKKTSSGEIITLNEICEELGTTAKKARTALRGKVDKPGTRWEWPSDHEDIEKVKGLLK